LIAGLKELVDRLVLRDLDPMSGSTVTPRSEVNEWCGSSTMDGENQQICHGQSADLGLS
jgi:hypothetical protein